MRIFGDFSVTVNPVSKLDRYPIPYQQLLLDDGSKKYVVINTHKGLFRYTRLPFGISSAPGIFQRVIESILQGVNGVVVYDILISESTEEQHLGALDEVLSRLDRSGLRVKRRKCEFI